MKHLLGGGASIGGCNHAPAELSERAIRSYFLPPFQAAIEAEGMTIMPGHNDVASIPAHASKWLLTDVVKNELRIQRILYQRYGRRRKSSSDTSYSFLPKRSSETGFQCRS